MLYIRFIETLPPTKKRRFRTPFYGWAVIAFVIGCIFISGMVAGFLILKG